MSQPEITIGLIGHIDHGKTTFVEHLTGQKTSKHSEEIKRGITIRLGYANTTFYQCPSCKPPKSYTTTKKCKICGAKTKKLRDVSFVDAPGHEMLMATMLSGVAVMDGAILLIAANEPCPAPQTKEHLMAYKMLKHGKLVVLQSKIDLVTKEEAKQHYQAIVKFLKSMGMDAPIIPISAINDLGLDTAICAIEKIITTPKRNEKEKPLMHIIRSFDVNKPGTKIKNLQGGVLGGVLLKGTLKIGDKIEIKPGHLENGKWKSIKTKIVKLFSGNEQLDRLHSGGSAAIGTNLDPYLTKSDSLAGNVVGLVNTVPEPAQDLKCKTKLLDHVVGQEMAVTPLKMNETLMIIVGTSATTALITGIKDDQISLRLKRPLCFYPNQQIVISRRINQKWRLIGSGKIES